jgi:hypothetical protein
MRKYEMKRTEKKSEEPKVKAAAPAKVTLPTADLSSAGSDLVTLVADYGVGPIARSSVVAKQLKDANRAINRMKNQKQGT